MTMIGMLVWGGRETGAGNTGCTHDRAERQVMDRIVETGGWRCLVADSPASAAPARNPPRSECLSEISGRRLGTPPSSTSG